MALLVQKFGGSSLTDLTKLETIARRIKLCCLEGHKIVVVLSALQGETDRLIGLANLVSSQPTKREYDALLATGEQVAACLMAMALNRIGVQSQSMNAWQAGIQTDAHHKRASIMQIDSPGIKRALNNHVVPIITGFQGVGEDKGITTLGRGGSDTTALAVAAAIEADECQIFVDVGGVYTTDPKIEPGAQLLENMSIDQLLAHACSGAKVMQKRSVALAARHRVPMRICPTFSEEPGTVIMYNEKPMLEKTEVKAIAFAKNQVMLQIRVINHKYGDLQDLLKWMEQSGLEVEHTISQGISRSTAQGYHDLSCLIAAEDFGCLKSALDTWLQKAEPLDYRILRNVAKVSLLGYCMTRNMEITHTIMSIGKDFQIDFHIIQGSDQQIAMVVEQRHVEVLVRKLHSHFRLDRQPVKVKEEDLCEEAG